MKTLLTLRKSIVASLLLVGALNLPAQGTAFTYQGRLNDGAAPASGIYDLRFTIHDALSGGAQQGGPLTNAATSVSNGLFTVTLNFGASVFNGVNRWLEIQARTNGGGAFTPLTPRQAITATPYALTASNLSGTLSATQLTGTLPNAQLSPSVSLLGASIDSTELTDGTIVNADISPSAAIADTKLATIATAGKVADSALSANVSKLGSSIGSSEIIDGTVTTNDLSATVLNSAFWNLGGNSGTTPGTYFIGTSDNQALELKVNSTRAMRMQPDIGSYGSPSLVGGAPVNVIYSGCAGSVIAGGGAVNYLGMAYINSIYANFATISGGRQNTIDFNAYGSTIGGGYDNTIPADATMSIIGGGIRNTNYAGMAVIGGGMDNTIGGSSDAATIGGGLNNIIQGHIFQPTIGGGAYNIIQTYSGHSTIGGGAYNSVGFDSSDSTIAGGMSNDIGNQTHMATIAGGQNNEIGTQNDGATIGGGESNTILSSSGGSTLAGGFQNTIRINTGISTIGGGWNNTIQDNVFFGTISGGKQNSVAGSYGSVPGGDNNAAGTNSLAAGHRAKATHTGSFVWADSTDVDFNTTATNQFLIRAAGGVGIGTNAPQQALHVIGNILASGTIIGSSDYNLKENLAPITPRTVLDKVAALPISEWNFKNESTIRHIGPMAQDFYAAFSVGMDDKHIATVDAAGVALAAIQGLNQKLEEQRAQNAELKCELEKLKQLVDKLNHSNN